MEAALAIIAPALAALIGAVALYVRALARKVNANAAQMERRMRRLTAATGVSECEGEPILTPPFGVPIQLPIDESEKHRR